jgi:hypothetical protein
MHPFPSINLAMHHHHYNLFNATANLVFNVPVVAVIIVVNVVILMAMMMTDT